MQDLEIEGTVVLEKNLAATQRVVVNEGGTRSSKTYSLAQMFVIKLMNMHNEILTISRKTMPSLRMTVMRDFFEILGKLDKYSEKNHDKTNNLYYFGDNIVEFVSMDQPQKKRGAKRDYLWMNEANEFTFEDFIQLSMRTSKQIFLDYNPSDDFHWIYDRVCTRSDAILIRSNYLDNPFIDSSLITEIEGLKNVDENYWRIYGLGERGQSATKIYNNWDIVSGIPENFDDVVFGIDFGFNNPSVLVGVFIKDQEFTFHEFVYKSGMTNNEFIQECKRVLPEELTMKLFKADSAEPDRIKEFADAGFNIVPVKKGKNTVKDGIDKLKLIKIHVTAQSLNIIKEIKSYKWKVDKDGRVLDEPVKVNDHAMDSARYAVGVDSEEVPVEIFDVIHDDSVQPVRIGDL